ncbi:alcohol dehydrogenase catalytic domain-containing protein [Patescibacteria group bacterium]|nr:alcohol dehydrogenase catalytic domain-containing protein [Patescibacteria group bacterium]
MKALVFQEPKNILLKEVPVPFCPTDGILLKVKGCGLCGSDLRTYHSGHKNVIPPWILGHEIAGVVEEIGREVKGYKKGDRLAVAPPVYCGKCYFCLRGEYDLCLNIKEIAQHWPGGFAEYMVIPKEALLLGNVNFIPKNVSFYQAAISEPLSSCIKAQQMAQVEIGDTVVMIGAGPIGCFHTELAHDRGASRVILMDIMQERLNLAERFQPEVLINNSQSGYISRVFKETNNLGANVVIVACPSGKAQTESIKMVRKGGRIIFFGGLPHNKSQVFLDTNLIHYKNLQVYGSSRFAPEHNKLALKMIAEGKIKADQYITHILPLENYQKAIQLLEDGKTLKVVLTLNK